MYEHKDCVKPKKNEQKQLQTELAKKGNKTRDKYSPTCCCSLDERKEDLYLGAVVFIRRPQRPLSGFSDNEEITPHFSLFYLRGTTPAVLRDATHSPPRGILGEFHGIHTISNKQVGTLLQ